MRRSATVSVLVLLWTCGQACAATVDDLVFIHHSCGQNWLSSGLDSALVAKDYIDERNDIYYGTTMSPDVGRPASLGSVPGDSTNMNHWLLWFNDYLDGIKSQGCASGVNRIIMFKSCFPISDVTSAGTEPGDPFSATQTIANYNSVYRNPNGAGLTYAHGGYAYKALEDVFAANPDFLFIPVTAPPLSNSATTDANGYRARQFNTWLTTTWLTTYNLSHPGLNNAAVFDWFNVLANDNGATSYPNRLKAAYGGTSADSHPNTAANQYSTQLFATTAKNFIDEAYCTFAYHRGDATIDNKIDGADLAIWQQNYDPLGTNGATNRWRLGDFNADGRIDGGDLALWQQNYAPLGYSGLDDGAPLTSLDFASVPEPATLTLLAAGLAGAGAARRRRTRRAAHHITL